MFNLIFEAPESPANLDGSALAIRTRMNSSLDGSSLANWYESPGILGSYRKLVVTSVEVIPLPGVSPFPRASAGWQDSVRYAADLRAWNEARTLAWITAAPIPPSRGLREGGLYRVRVRGTAEIPDGAGGWTSVTWERAFRRPATRLDGGDLPPNLATHAGDLVVIAHTGAWRPAYVASA